MGGGRTGRREMPSRLPVRKDIPPDWRGVEAEISGINPDGMAQVPATQQPHPTLPQGAFFIGACFCASMDPAVSGISGIIIEHGIDPPAPGAASVGNAPPRQNPMAMNKAMMRCPKKLVIGPMIGCGLDVFKQVRPH